MRKMRIKDDYHNTGRGGSITIPIIAISALATATLLKTYWDDKQLDTDGFLSSMSPNEMFCRNPEFADGEFVFDDPFEQFNARQSMVYAQFWHDSTDHKAVDFHFDYNRTATNTNLSFFDSIPQEVIDDPDVTFILSGHATDDLVHAYSSGAIPPDDFKKQHAQHVRNNFQVAAGRIEFIKGKLVEVLVQGGRTEEEAISRIVENNHNTRYNDRRVDLEVCVKNTDTPEA